MEVDESGGGSEWRWVRVEVGGVDAGTVKAGGSEGG